MVNPGLQKNTQKYRENFINEVISSTTKERRGIPSKSLSKIALPAVKKPARIFGFEKKKKVTGYDAILQVHLLRTAEYWTKAAVLGIPFLPDFMRIPTVAGYQGHLKYAIRYLIQNIFDKKVIMELLETDAIASPQDIPIPDGVSNFLTRYYSTGSIEQSLDDMRQNFAEYKNKIVEWEARVKTANRSEKLNIINEVGTSIASSLKKAKVSDITDITASLIDSIAPEIFTGNMGSIPGSLPMIKLGVDFVRAHFARKRIWYSFTGHKEASRIKNRLDLLKHAFGRSLEIWEIDNFTDLTKALYKLSKRPKAKYLKNIPGPEIPKVEKKPIDILEERLAKGEITLREFDKKKKRLRRHNRYRK